MATIIKRTWYSREPTGHKVKRVAYGYTLQVDGKQERKMEASWMKDDAEKAFAARLLEVDGAAPPAPKTLGQAAQEYLEFKRAKGKRAIVRDVDVVAKIIALVGAEPPIRDSPRSGSRTTIADESPRRPGAAASCRALRVQHDAPVCPLESRPAARCRRSSRVVQQTLTTNR